VIGTAPRAEGVISDPTPTETISVGATSRPGAMAVARERRGFIREHAQTPRGSLATRPQSRSPAKAISNSNRSCKQAPGQRAMGPRPASVGISLMNATNLPGEREQYVPGLSAAGARQDGKPCHRADLRPRREKDSPRSLSA